jgi:hypothetical protein
MPKVHLNPRETPTKEYPEGPTLTNHLSQVMEINSIRLIFMNFIRT